MSNNCCNCARVEQTTWQDEPVVFFSAGGYEALLAPGIGANLVSLKDIKRGLDILRTPADVETLRLKYKTHGMPVLFPPARIEDGTFEAAGRVYKFPINEPKNNNFLHGFVNNKKWQVTKMEAEDGEAEVEVTFKCEKTTDIFEFFPHEFELKITYNLSNKGLVQTVTIINNSDSPMPMGLGFHTAFNVPFHPDSKGEDCSIKMSVCEEWEIGPRFLPTGNILPLDNIGRKYREEGVIVQGFPIFSHFTAKPMDVDGREFHGAIIDDKSKGLRLVYEVGQGYKHWVIWNDTGDNGFICPEPQTWAVNAPNINLPDEVTGFKLLSSKEVWKDCCKVYVEEI